VLVNGQPRHGEATGIHAANRNILVRWADGERGQLGMTRDSQLLGGMTEDESRTWLRLTETVNAADRDIYAFREAHKIDLHGTPGCDARPSHRGRIGGQGVEVCRG
jgi:hypothetical protein